jgi:RIO-like serine/threonine protein kinase
MEIHFDQPIGSGTFADIWKGFDEIGRKVAIKVLREEGKAASSILQHAQSLARAKHPNVVEIYSIEELVLPDQSQEKCIVMEYVNGMTLAERLANSLKIKEAYKIGKAIITGVQYIHVRGLAHMDLHDRNILVTNEGEVKIIDIMYINSLSQVTEKVRVNHINSDISQLIEVLSKILMKTVYGGEAKKQFKNQLESQPDLNRIDRCYDDLFTVFSENIEHVIDLLDVIPIQYEDEHNSDAESLTVREFQFTRSVQLHIHLV